MAEPKTMKIQRVSELAKPKEPARTDAPLTLMELANQSLKRRMAMAAAVGQREPAGPERLPRFPKEQRPYQQPMGWPGTEQFWNPEAVIPQAINAVLGQKFGERNPRGELQFDPDVGGLNLLGAAGRIVYHGSPHLFDKFDIAKIGTGEGAQAYGHGLYFAETPEVASFYQKSIPKWLGFSGTARQHAMDAKGIAEAKGLTGDEVRQYARTWLSERLKLGVGISPWDRRFYQDAVNNYDDLIKLEGAFYEVDLPDEQIANMLDWDKPLSEQTQAIQDVIREGIPQTKWEIRPIQGQSGVFYRIVDSQSGSSLGGHGFPTQEAAAQHLAEYGTGMLPTTGKELYEDLASELGGPEKASQFLRDRGIPGIRYLDQSSRTAGEGTRNFVVFDDAILGEVKRK